MRGISTNHREAGLRRHAKRNMSYFKRGFLAVAVAALGVLMSACVAMPSPGERFVMVVKRIPSTRQELQVHPGLSLALERGVSREDVQSGRLVNSGCYVESSQTDHWIARQHGFTLLPPGLAVAEGDILEIAAEEADATDGRFARFYGRFVQRTAPQVADFFPYKYSPSGKAFRCDAVRADGRMRVQVYSVAHFWDFDLTAAEAERNRQISDDELQQGRIAMGECSPGVDSWALWKVRLPTGLGVGPGDYLEAMAGADEAPRSLGPLSVALRKVAEPPKSDFIRTQGRLTVGCGAHAAGVAGGGK
jgi:hypothetical protein